MSALRALALGLVASTIACGGGNARSTSAYPAGSPPPSAFAHPGYAYYGQAAAPPPVLSVPPTVMRSDPVNTMHLASVASAPRRCDVPLEVAPNVFVHVDCMPYARVSVAVKHATPAKLALMQQGRARWNAAAPRTSSLVGAAGDAAAPLPDLVDHRLNGLEGPVKDQAAVGACTAFALSSVIDNSLRRANLNVATSAEHVWSHYGYPTMDHAAQGNLNRAIAADATLPYSPREGCELARDTSEDCGQTYRVPVNSAAGDAALQQKLRAAEAAGGHRVVQFEELESPANIQELLTTLASGADLWVGFHIDSIAWQSRRLVSYVIPDWITPDGGHAVALAGYRRVGNAYQFLVHNSWSASWGDRGYAWVSQAMVQRWMHVAYKLRTDVDGGSPSPTPVPPAVLPASPWPLPGNWPLPGTLPWAPPAPTPPRTDEDCAGDQVMDWVLGSCRVICPDLSRPANGQCGNAPAPAPQALPLPNLANWPALPTIPGWPAPPTPPAPAQPVPPGAPQPVNPFLWFPPNVPLPASSPWPLPPGFPLPTQ